MLESKKCKNFFRLTLVLTLFLMSTCSKEEASDYEKLGAKQTGSGTIQGNIINYSTNSGLSGVNVIFTSSGATTYSTTTDSNGDYSQSSLPLDSYTISYSKSGYISSTQSGALETDQQTLSAAKLTMLPNTCGSGNITGTIKNALNGNTVGGVTLNARSGFNVTSGTIVKSATTVASGGSKGTYTLGTLDAGLYTVQTSKTGHMSTAFNVRLCGGASGQNANISDSLPAGAMRMILAWEGSEDFDSHLLIPCTSGTCSGSNKNDKSHLWWTTDQDTSAVYNGVTTNDYHYYYDIVGTGSKSDNVTLDQDNMAGTGSGSNTGPETITISKLRSGTYRYLVHAYDRSVASPYTSNTRNIADNATVVQVCYETSCRNLYPPNSGGDLWTVFDFNKDDGGLKILNIMGNEQSPIDVDEH